MNIIYKENIPQNSEFTCIYRTTPYQFVNTAPDINVTKKVGDLSIINNNLITIKPKIVPTKKSNWFCTQ